MEKDYSTLQLLKTSTLVELLSKFSFCSKEDRLIRKNIINILNNREENSVGIKS